MPRVIKAPSDTVPSGQVSDQNPAGGSKVGKGSTVTLTVSSGMPKVQRAECRRPGRQLGGGGAWRRSASHPKIVQHLLDRAARHRHGAAARAGDRVPKGANVRINVSRGAKPVQVPDVTGEPFANARSALAGPGLHVVRVDIQSDQAKGVVVAVRSAGGHERRQGLEDHAVRLEGPGDDPDPGRARPEPGRRDVDPARRGPQRRSDHGPGHRPEPGRDRASRPDPARRAPTRRRARS